MLLLIVMSVEICYYLFKRVLKIVYIDYTDECEKLVTKRRLRYSQHNNETYIHEMKEFMSLYGRYKGQEFLKCYNVTFLNKLVLY